LSQYNPRALVTIALLGSLPGAAARGDVPMPTDLGRTLCRNYLDPARPIPHAVASDSIYVQWVAGALTGIAERAHDRSLTAMTLEEVATTFTTYCVQHPSKRILDAVRAMEKGYRLPAEKSVDGYK
jgi:hypothetical protein